MRSSVSPESASAVPNRQGDALSRCAPENAGSGQITGQVALCPGASEKQAVRDPLLEQKTSPSYSEEKWPLE